MDFGSRPRSSKWNGQIWEVFLAELRRAHIRLKDDPYELSWDWNKEGGAYTSKLGYLTIQAPTSVEEA
jgi:hypothetical protein